jgi:hypothetical protein
MTGTEIPTPPEKPKMNHKPKPIEGASERPLLAQSGQT